MSDSPSQQPRQRLDLALVALGHARSRAQARDMIKRGHVLIAGQPATKASQMVAHDLAVTMTDPARHYVSRAALKLIHGLERFDYDVDGRTALDLGASTGGFSQVLLERAIARIYAVDVGHDQLAASVSADPRVLNLEGVNGRDLDSNLIPEPLDCLVSDVSFISLKLALPPALSLAAPGAWGLFLVKPQFEVGREGLGKGGLVKSPELARETAEQIADWLDGQANWRVDGLFPSPIAGGDGNGEFLLGARHD